MDDLRAGKFKEYASYMTSGSIPFTVLIGPGKKVVQSWTGSRDAAEFTRELRSSMK